MSSTPGIAALLREALLFQPPLDPDAPEARQWLRNELAKAPYQAAQPTWFDRASRAFLDWITSLTLPGGDGFAAWIPVILTLVAVAVVVAAFLIFGLPRLNRRSRLPTALLGEDDRRASDEIRRAARTAAEAGDWARAIEEMFRALARSLSERTVLAVTPGTTAQEVASRAAGAFPGERARLADAARLFDRVRYLGEPGSERGYLALDELERDVRAAQPAGLFEPVSAVAR